MLMHSFCYCDDSNAAEKLISVHGVNGLSTNFRNSGKKQNFQVKSNQIKYPLILEK